jgi:hypothetical protein
MIDAIAPGRRANLRMRIEAAEQTVNDQREFADVRATAARELERLRQQLAELEAS